MTKKEEVLLSYIAEHPDISVNQLCSNFALSSKQLLDSLLRLRKGGYYIRQNYHNNGNITLRLSLHPDRKTIYTKKEEKLLRFAAISDTHFGHYKFSMRYVEQVYQYCLEQRIHLIFHLGDVVEGVENTVNTRYKSVDRQFESFLKKYPYDPYILNFILLGNHDNWSSKTTKFNSLLFLTDKRLDFIPVGMNIGTVAVNKELIAFCHNTGVNGNSDVKLVLKGHSHQYRLVNNENSCMIQVPTLSRINTMSQTQDYIPSFLDVQINLYANRFSAISVKQLQLRKRITQVSNCKVNFLKK